MQQHLICDWCSNVSASGKPRPKPPQLLPPAPLAEHQGSPGLDGKCGPSSVPWVCLVVFSQTDILGSRTGHASVWWKSLQALHLHFYHYILFLCVILSLKSHRSSGTTWNIKANSFGTSVWTLLQIRVCVCGCAAGLTLSQVSSGEGFFGCPESQLSANHAGCSDVPQVVTHSAPLPLSQHLNAALPEARPRLQAHDRLENKRKTI